MNKVLQWAIALILILIVMVSVVVRFTVIEPGYTGIRINKLVDRGVTSEDVITGYVFYMPLFTTIVKYPTHVQRIAWTHDITEGKAVNEELTFNTSDSVPVNIDVAISYMLLPEKVPAFYTQFRCDDIKDFTNGSLRDTTRNVITQIGGTFTFDTVNGQSKEKFITDVITEMNKRMGDYGISIQQFGLIGSLRPPVELLNAVNAKTRAIQQSIQTENEIRSAIAEAKKKVALAEGEAAANRALASSLDPKLLEWERLKIQREAIKEWNGVMPSVVGGGGMLLNVPTPYK